VMAKVFEWIAAKKHGSKCLLGDDAMGLSQKRCFGARGHVWSRWQGLGGCVGKCCCVFRLWSSTTTFSSLVRASTVKFQSCQNEIRGCRCLMAVLYLNTCTYVCSWVRDQVKDRKQIRSGISH
jgi:hypothetical protein